MALMKCFYCGGNGLAGDGGACPYCNGNGRIEDTGAPEPPNVSARVTHTPETLRVLLQDWLRYPVQLTALGTTLGVLANDGTLWALLYHGQEPVDQGEWVQLPALPQPEGDR